jgi:NADPH-dependent curcumin reductase CurA
MTPLRSREVRLNQPPTGIPKLEDFDIAEVEVPSPLPGSFIVRNSYCSIDPFMRMMMSELHPVDRSRSCRVGEVISGGAVGQVVESNSSAFAEGDWLVHQRGWREVSVVHDDDDGLRRIDPALSPVSTALGVLGMPGLTSWYGMCMYGVPKPDETVYVSSAGGAVGSLAAQLARSRGSRVIVSAGSPKKLEWLERLKFDAVFDYRARPVVDSLAELAPGGIDLYFDNVGGRHLEAAITNMAFAGRIIACGAVSIYNDSVPTPGPTNLDLLFTKELVVRGVRSRAHKDSYPEFLAEVAPMVASGAIEYAETIVGGIEKAPAAFIGLFSGTNVGKMLVEVTPQW